MSQHTFKPLSLLLVLDTNIALDLFVFGDPAAAALRAPIYGDAHGVLAYPQIVKRLSGHGQSAAAVLDAFDQRVCIVPTAPKAAYTCKDPDDQKFIDLAVAHRAALVSKDAHVLSMARRLARLGVVVSRQWVPALAGVAGSVVVAHPSHVALGAAH
jgi:hypothetical protein